ncbi:antitoxin [Microseira sp. BLCC-F43]|jgi:virulence-associated protein VagC|uniref:antitoxin n=1 Tax=Microseira sp. BLCC-F43 TaxID=3153602 RepID=UPI0035BB7828
MAFSQLLTSQSEKFPQAANSWNLSQLYKDLTAAKRLYTKIQKQQLTPLEQAYLRGILCGQSPPEIATVLHRDIKGLRVDLSRGLYRYIETLTQKRPRNWKEVPVILENAGYKQKAIVEIDNIVQIERSKMETVKLLMNGDNQSVILPKEFQIQGSEVYIKKIGGVIVLIPKENPWQALFDSLNLFSEDFMETREQPILEIREAWE